MLSNLPTYRSWFPHLQTGKIWLNHAAISPLSSRVNAALNAHLLNRTAGDIDVFPSIGRLCDRTKQNLATLINTAPDRIGFVPNTTEGLNILASGIDWKSGDRIMLNDVEFPANVVPFLNLKRLGVEIDFVKNRNGEILVEDIEAMITPRTKLLSISFVQFLSGFKADVTAIGELCKRHNIIFCVDAIQGLGASPLDVKKAQIDFLSNGGHKWLMGLMGLGFVFITEELQSRVHQRHAGWMSNKNFFGNFFTYRIDFDDTARRYENGIQNYLAIIALGESTSTLLEAGIDHIQSHLHSLTDDIVDFADAEGIEIVTPRMHAQRAGIITIKLERAEQIFQKLTEKNIIVSLREGMLRIAPHFYNSYEEIAIFCETLQKERIAVSV